jgi:hypothetical protein
MLGNGQFDIAGYRFGCDTPTKVLTLQTGGLSWRVQDQENPVGDGVWFGSDYVDPEPVEMDISVTGNTPSEARQELGRFARAWHSFKRDTPGAVTALRYGLHGEERVVYGRPRDFTFDETTLYSQPRTRGTVLFERASHLFYGPARELPLTITPGQAGGLVYPIVFPWGTVQGGVRQGVIEDGGGTVATDDVELTIRGPIARPVVSGPGWSISLDLSLAWDQAVTISARRRTALRENGGSVAGRLSRRTRLSDIRIPPGPSEIKFAGEDTTGTSQLLVSWRPAYESI